MGSTFKKPQSRENFYRRHAHICFYTGLVCDSIGPHKRSVEHLVPLIHIAKWKGYEPGFGRDNKVVAVQYINCIIGNAPLRVKYALQEHLLCLNVDKVVPDKLRNFYKNATQKFLNKYKVLSILPWNYTDNTLPFNVKNTLKENFVGLLFKEECARFYPEFQHSHFHKNI